MDFQRPRSTEMVFSNLSASVPRQKAFIESLISFISTCGFNGLDLDWEYPVAEDRSGREVDYANFPIHGAPKECPRWRPQGRHHHASYIVLVLAALRYQQAVQERDILQYPVI